MSEEFTKIEGLIATLSEKFTEGLDKVKKEVNSLVVKGATQEQILTNLGDSCSRIEDKLGSAFNQIEELQERIYKGNGDSIQTRVKALEVGLETRMEDSNRSWGRIIGVVTLIFTAFASIGSIVMHIVR